MSVAAEAHEREHRRCCRGAARGRREGGPAVPRVGAVTTRRYLAGDDGPWWEARGAKQHAWAGYSGWDGPSLGRPERKRKRPSLEQLDQDPSRFG